jgi:hypothetical protein
MKRISMAFLLILWMILAGNLVSAGEQENPDSVKVLEPALSLTSVSFSSDSVKLTANLWIRKSSGIFYLENASILFTVSDGVNSRQAGIARTDGEGNAILMIPAKNGLPADKEGKTTYSASFEGTSLYASAFAEVTAKRAKVTLRFSQEDSIRHVHVRAVQVEADGAEKVLPKETVNIYVPRLFSLLKIGDATLDESGAASVEFPGNLVGDSLGNIVVIGKIEEHDLFGNAEGRASVTWGIPKQYYTAETPSRELWTPVAPVWMIITLIIMLTGVWAHYLYAVIQMILIRRHNKQKKEYL